MKLQYANDMSMHLLRGNWIIVDKRHVTVALRNMHVKEIQIAQ